MRALIREAPRGAVSFEYRSIGTDSAIAVGCTTSFERSSTSAVLESADGVGVIGDE